MAKDDTEKKPEPKFEPTVALRIFHPAGQIQTARVLQQLWVSGDDKEWRDVELVNEDDAEEIAEEDAPIEE